MGLAQQPQVRKGRQHLEVGLPRLGHRRLVADVVLRGEVAFSASWDGTIRRWGLGATQADREALAASVSAAWSMTVEDVLSARGSR